MPFHLPTRLAPAYTGERIRLALLATLGSVPVGSRILRARGGWVVTKLLITYLLLYLCVAPERGPFKFVCVPSAHRLRHWQHQHQHRAIESHKAAWATSEVSTGLNLATLE